jgi:hypothetical protein
MEHTTRVNDDGSTTFSVSLKDLSVAQLIQVNQNLGRQVDALRAQRSYLKEMIAQRLAAGERENPGEEVEAVEIGSAVAPGVVLEASSLH